MRHLYLAATGQNRGKTTAALGLLDLFVSRGLRTGFMKPVGQRTVIEDGQPADEDAVLMRAVFGLPEPLSVMSPVHIPRGFTKAYIAGEVVEDLPARIVGAHRCFADHDVLLIEGTGHAGVGAVIGLSNAAVASLLGAPAVIISEGGVGRPIDEIVLNAALFAAHGVEVAGAIVNKVDLVAQPGIARTLERGLASHGIPLLAILPLRPILSNPTLEMIQDGVSGELLSAGAEPGQVIDGVAIGAMEPGEMRRRLGRATLVLVPGDREETILSLTGARLPGGKRRRGPERPPATRREARAAAREVFASPVIDETTRREAAGLVLTGGTRPREEVVDAIRAAGLFATVVPEDTYTVASEIHDLLVKTHASNREKIAMIKSLVAENLDVERILEVARPAFASA